jgi:phenylacetate-CoA ligase
VTDRVARLRAVVAHAYENVAHYRRIYEDAAVSPADLRSIDDMKRFPTVSAADLSADPESFRARNLKAYRVSSSSGTVGAPKTLYRTAEDTDASTFAMVELFIMAGVRTDSSMYIGQPFDLAHLGYISLDACRRLGVLAVPAGLAVTDDDMMRMILRYRTETVFSAPSRVHRLALCAMAERVALPIHNVLLAGEPTYPEQKRNIEDAWGVTPHSLYGSEETDALAGTCSEHQGLHLLEEQVHLELLGGDDVGEGVYTCLNQMGTPLVRYRLGDLISIDRSPCRCGRLTPRLQVQGRMNEVLNLYDGIKLSAAQVAAALHSVLGEVPRFQVICREDAGGHDLLTVRVVPFPTGHPFRPTAEVVESALWAASLDLAPARAIGSVRIDVDLSAEYLEETRRGKASRMLDLRGNRNLGLGEDDL